MAYVLALLATAVLARQFDTQQEAGPVANLEEALGRRRFYGWEWRLARLNDEESEEKAQDEAVDQTEALDSSETEELVEAAEDSQDSVDSSDLKVDLDDPKAVKKQTSTCMKVKANPEGKEEE